MKQSLGLRKAAISLRRRNRTDAGLVIDDYRYGKRFREYTSLPQNTEPKYAQLPTGLYNRLKQPTPRDPTYTEKNYAYGR